MSDREHNTVTIARRRTRDGRTSLFGSSFPFAESAEENLSECLPKVGSEYCVDHRIQQAIQISEPGEDADDFLVDG